MKIKTSFIKNIIISIVLTLSIVMVCSCDLSNFFGDPEVTKIVEMINSIGDVSLDSKEVLDTIENLYNGLSDDVKAKISNFNVFESKKEEYENLYQRSIHPGLVIYDRISEIPYPLEYTTEEKANIDKILEDYNELSDDEKALVTNYSTLKSVLAEYEEHEKELEIQKLKDQCININNLIKTIPSELSYNLEEKTLIDNIISEYNKLSNDAKKYVEGYDLVTNAEKAFKRYDEEQKVLKLKEACAEINGLIKTIPSTLTYSDQEKTLINNIISKYNALTKEQKAYVENYDLVTKAQNSFAEHEILVKVNPINEDIESIKDITKLTLSDETKINNIKKAYEALTSKEKEYVKNYKYVTDGLVQIDLLKQAKVIRDLISNLPISVTLSDEADITKAKKAYDDASANVKALVTNYQSLQYAWNTLCVLKQGSTPYKVYFNTNGGELTGLQTETASSLEVIATININNYNKGFWSVYTTQCVLYNKDTVVADTGSTYAFNLKVGFSYNSTKKQYIVDQIIADGTGFTDATRQGSDYFVICNGANGADMSALSAVTIGTIVESNKDLSSAATTDSLGATLSFSTESSTGAEKYYIEYTGINTLSTPTLYGKKFVGWYDNPEFNGNPITEVGTSMTLYAKYEREQKIVTTETILNAVSDYVDSDTEDNLISENADARFSWSSSNDNLYSVKDGIGKTQRLYQTHKKQTCKVSCVINYKTGGSKTVSKDIIINPVTFDDLPSTPVATYFASGAASSYKYYSDRYKTEQTFFSEKAKETLNIIYYSSICPTTSGECTVYSANYVQYLMELKNSNVRVIASIDGVSTTSAAVFVECCSTDAKVKDFAKRLMDVCEKYNFDGLDIDWEYISSQPITAAAYSRLMKALRAEMASRQDEGGTPYMLTAAIPANSWTMDTSRYNFSDLNTYLDYINIMSYDANKSDVASHLAPHYSSSYDNGYGFGDVYGVNQFSSRGISKSKLMLGCAGYGKAYQVTGTSANANYPGLGAKAKLIQISEYAGMGSFASGTLYGNVVGYLEANSKYKKYIEYNKSGQIVGAYLYNATDKIFASYDSSETISAKFEYADKIEGMGVMCWAHTEDMSDHYINTCYDCRKK